jgi:hypothetical protein
MLLRKLILAKFIILICLLISYGANAQEEVKKDTTYWKTKYAFGINLNQSAFSDNWTGGGVSSIAIGTALNVKPSYRKGKITWNNEFDFIYGAIRNRGQNARKSADRILLDSKVGYDLGEKLNLFFSANFLTQAAPGYTFETIQNEEVRTTISKFMNPGYLIYGLGLEYVPTSYLKVRVSPISPRHTFVLDTTLHNNFPRNYGVEIGETVRNEWGGFQLWTDFDKDVMENLNIKTRYFMFGNYETGKLDHRVDFILTAKVNKFLNVNLTAIMLRDKDQADKIQLSQVLGIGFLLKN